jgi:hypothetical protein
MTYTVFDFGELDSTITTVANSVLGNLETKENVQNILFRLVILSCSAYKTDPNFKSKIDMMAKYHNM